MTLTVYTMPAVVRALVLALTLTVVTATSSKTGSSSNMVVSNNITQDMHEALLPLLAHRVWRDPGGR